MPKSLPRKVSLFEVVPKVEEIVACLRDSLYSLDRCPKVQRLERIINSVDLKIVQLKEDLEASDVDRARIRIRRIMKLVSRFYRLQ